MRTTNAITAKQDKIDDEEDDHCQNVEAHVGLDVFADWVGDFWLARLHNCFSVEMWDSTHYGDHAKLKCIGGIQIKTFKANHDGNNGEDFAHESRTDCLVVEAKLILWHSRLGHPRISINRCTALLIPARLAIGIIRLGLIAHFYCCILFKFA